MASSETAIDCGKVIELVGDDGAVTRLVQRPDGGIEVHTGAMAKSGRAVYVPRQGSVRAFRL